MLKILGWVVLLGAVFASGYYAGQRPIGELKKTVTNLSHNIMDTTIGLERTMRQRHGLVDAKAQVIEAKSELLDRNLGNAAKDLDEAVEQLEKASAAERDAGRSQTIRPLIAKVKEAQLELSMGKAIPRARLDEIQKELDALLSQER